MGFRPVLTLGFNPLLEAGKDRVESKKVGSEIYLRPHLEVLANRYFFSVLTAVSCHGSSEKNCLVSL